MQAEERGSTFSPGQPSILFRSSVDWVGPTALGRTDCFTQPTDLNVNYIQKHPPTHTQKNVHPHTWLPMAQSGWHIKLSITDPNWKPLFSFKSNSTSRRLQTASLLPCHESCTHVGQPCLAQVSCSRFWWVQSRGGPMHHEYLLNVPLTGFWGIAKVGLRTLEFVGLWASVESKVVNGRTQEECHPGWWLGLSCAEGMAHRQTCEMCMTSFA